MLQEVLYQGFTTLEQRDYKMITSNFVNRRPTWQYKKKAWMTSLLFKEFPYFFKKFIQGGMSFTNMHLFVLDWHDKHVTLKVIVMHKIFG